MDHKETLTESLTDVLEKFAFMFADPVPASDLTPPEESFRLATIGFSGPKQGTIQVASSAPFCMQLAANVLGIEMKCITPDTGSDAFKELLNVVCGELLERMAGKDVVFNLTIPQVAVKPVQEWSALADDPDIGGLLVDEMPLLFKMEMRS